MKNLIHRGKIAFYFGRIGFRTIYLLGKKFIQGPRRKKLSYPKKSIKRALKR